MNTTNTKSGRLQARLIGERSAGMTAVEIHDGNGKLIWSHKWFLDGCSASGYVDGLRDAIDCMRNCANVRKFEGYTDNPQLIDVEDDTGIMAIYDTRTGWSLGDDAHTMGQQSSEIVDALMLAGLLPANAEHVDKQHGDIVAAIAKHLVAIIN